MSTRSCAGYARLDQDGKLIGFNGIYIHFDGYPNGVGKTLAEESQRLGTETVLNLLHQHRPGWSCVAGCQLDLEPYNMRIRQDLKEEQRERASFYPDDEPEMLVDETQDCGIEYAYCFEKRGDTWHMHVVETAHGQDEKLHRFYGGSEYGKANAWNVIAVLDLSKPLPDFQSLSE